ncbi:MAG TPA: hypothetical protein QF468_09460 [Nitrospinota bacterium]|jgi:Flp pilus assembly protein TadB|nr:hypothetical protein [Nitrospinota bacterium]
MQTFLKMFLSVIIFSIFVACSGEKKEKEEKEEAKAKSDHLYRSQFDALEKAKNVEKELQDTFSEKLKKSEEQEK